MVIQRQEKEVWRRKNIINQRNETCKSRQKACRFERRLPALWCNQYVGYVGDRRNNLNHLLYKREEVFSLLLKKQSNGQCNFYELIIFVSSNFTGKASTMVSFHNTSLHSPVNWSSFCNSFSAVGLTNEIHKDIISNVLHLKFVTMSPSMELLLFFLKMSLQWFACFRLIIFALQRFPRIT